MKSDAFERALWRELEQSDCHCTIATVLEKECNLGIDHLQQVLNAAQSPAQSQACEPVARPFGYITTFAEKALGELEDSILSVNCVIKGKPEGHYTVAIYTHPPAPSPASACWHPASLMLKSAETGEPLYCELCDDKSGRHDAEQEETRLRAELRAEVEAHSKTCLQLATAINERDKLDSAASSQRALVEAISSSRFLTMLSSDIAMVSSEALHYFDNMDKSLEFGSIMGLCEEATERYHNDPIFRAKVQSLTDRMRKIVRAAYTAAIDAAGRGEG